MLQAEMYPKWLINTLMDSKLAFLLQGKSQSTNQQAELHYVDHAFIAEMCDEMPPSLENALSHDIGLKP